MICQPIRQLQIRSPSLVSNNYCRLRARHDLIESQIGSSRVTRPALESSTNGAPPAWPMGRVGGTKVATIDDKFVFICSNFSPINCCAARPVSPCLHANVFEFFFRPTTMARALQAFRLCSLPFIVSNCFRASQPQSNMTFAHKAAIPARRMETHSTRVSTARRCRGRFWTYLWNQARDWTGASGVSAR